MASLFRDSKTGHYRIDFQSANKKRKTVRLGKVTKRIAEETKVKVEALNAAKISGLPIDGETATWIRKIGDDLADKLSAVGLIEKSKRALLGEFIDSYISSRDDTKPRTVELYQQTRRNLVEFFGETKLLTEITPGDADKWRLHLLRQGLAENTVRRRIGRAKQFFTFAVRSKLITVNPFADLKSAVRAVPEKFHFVTREDAQKILDACPDVQWRAIFALCRFGGLRCPSEVLALKWSDVNWEHKRLLVPCPKLEHLPGGSIRAVPLFPELDDVLSEAFEQAEEKTEFVITRYRSQDQNLRTTFNKIVKRAGLVPWQKPFQNLRSTRETELAEEYPMHVVCAWIGNSQPVAQKHYLQLTDEHFERATNRCAAESAAQVQQNPQQQADAEKRTVSQTSSQVVDNSGFMLGVAKKCEKAQSDPAPRLGLDTDDVTSCTDNSLQLSQQTSAAKSAAVGTETDDPQLAQLIDLWPTLPGATRDDILRIAQDNTTPQRVSNE